VSFLKNTTIRIKSIPTQTRVKAKYFYRTLYDNFVVILSVVHEDVLTGGIEK